MDATATPEAGGIKLLFWQHILIFLFACIVLMSRRPDAILHPQFYAEDGHVWFADAYNLGWWHALFRAQDGYFQTFPRLGAALALLFPLALAPLVLNLIAIAVQALPVTILLSERSAAWGSLRFRAAMAAVYLALPNCREMGAIITSSQWVLALCVFLLLVAAPPEGNAGRAADIVLFALCGLTGPFCFLLVPIALYAAWRRRGRWGWIHTGILGAGCALQAWGLLVINPAGRAASPLGASVALFLRIVAGQVYLGTLLGGNGLAARAGAGMFVFLLCVAIGGTAIAAVCFAKATIEWRLLFVFSCLLLAASLASPAAYPPAGMTRWELLANVGGIRYWFFPTLAFAWCLLWCVRRRTGAAAAVSVLLLCAMSFGIVRDWHHPALKDLHYREFAQSFSSAPAGTAVVVPENPQGWTIRLVKRAAF